MEFPDPLVSGTLVRRYKRFLTDVELAGGKVVVAHCANPGSMLSVNAPGAEVWLSPARNPERKLRYTWELVRVGTGLVVDGFDNPHDLKSTRLPMVPQITNGPTIIAHDNVLYWFCKVKDQGNYLSFCELLRAI